MNIEMDVLIAIILITLIITGLFSYHCSIEKKMIFILLSMSIMMYSGLGISYKYIDNMMLGSKP